MADYSYFMVRVPSSAANEFQRLTAENNGEAARIKLDPPDTERHLTTGQNVADLLRCAKLQSSTATETEHAFFIRKREDDMKRLLSSISHHWRQPLNVLSLYSQEICELHELGKLNDSYVAEFNKTTLDTIQKMSQTIDDFIYTYRNIEYGIRKNLVYHVFDLIKLYVPELKFHKTSVSLKCSCSVHRGREFTDFNAYPKCSNAFVCNNLDIAKFNLAFTSILDNAKEAVCDAIKKGVIQKGLVSINIAVGENAITISIKNNGAPIDDNVKDRIFMPYFSTKDNGHRPGLGLYTAKTIISDALHGDLGFENCTDGVEFTIRLNNCPETDE